MLRNTSNGASKEDGLKLSGYHKKLKTMKKKFFVLYERTDRSPARLEYYDNKKKFDNDYRPKRIIELQKCFNINQRRDHKNEYVIALSTAEGGFGIVYEKLEDMEQWLNVLTSLAFGQFKSSQPPFEFVWQVVIQKKGLAESKGIIGNYHVCLTSKSITLLRIGPEKTAIGENRLPQIEFLLTTIRRCGDSQCVFYMEVGRQSVVGPGELWMESEDSATAQNMHQTILNAMSTSGESHIVEPMRKRSSSATEASKPMNVIPRKQTQSDCNKASHSPQSVLCFRERCDSLPSRNRASSESNSQAPSTSVALNRNQSGLGIRPTSHQRHSNSPPTCSATGCSESEESSVSIDETDENGSFLPCRYNSRNTGEVIPEENTDDIVSPENKNNHMWNPTSSSNMHGQTVNNVDKSYMCMAPVLQSSKDDINKLCGIKVIGPARDSGKCATTSSLSSLNYGSPKSEGDFMEYTSKDIAKNFIRDTDLHGIRPTRAYSTGSKFEHKLNKRITNISESEHGASRVRAFSVGSQSRKISRSDFQKGEKGDICSTSTTEANYNSNNNISFFNDMMLNMKSARDKKSTSAPLLINKSHNSVDRMSDLMEIDFSKSAYNTTNRLHHPSTKSLSQYSKSAPNTIRESDRKQDVLISTLCREDDILRNCLEPITIESISKTDNGYLEMRPVGNSSNKNSSTNLSKKLIGNVCPVVNTPKMLHFPDVPENKTRSVVRLSTTVLPNNKNNVNERNIRETVSTAVVNPSAVISNTRQAKNNLDINETHNSDSPDSQPLSTGEIQENLLIDKTDKKSSTIANILEPPIQLVPQSLAVDDNVSNNDDYVNIGNNVNQIDSRNLIDDATIVKCKAKNNIKSSATNPNNKSSHSFGDKNYNHELYKTGKPVESGYEILQIKSDSSLQSNKILNRPTSTRKEKHLNKSHDDPIRPTSANGSSIMPPSASSTLCGQTSSSTSCLNYIPSQTKTSRRELNTSNTKLNDSIDNHRTQTAVISRPSSVSSDHRGLYYASLDLPDCSGREVNSKTTKIDVSEPLPVIGSNTNVYAKIDFDHSDSSSSSSKNVIT